MRVLRFDKARVDVGEAAILLATNQDPWASYVYCSMYDYFKAGYERAPDRVFAVMPDFWWGMCDPEYADFNPFLDRIHRVMLRPSYNLPEGWVSLDEREL